MEKSENMKLDRLSVAQMLQEHPIKNEQEGYRQRYLWVLELLKMLALKLMKVKL